MRNADVPGSMFSRAAPRFRAVATRNLLRLVDMLGFPLMLVMITPLHQRVGANEPNLAEYPVGLFGKQRYTRSTASDGGAGTKPLASVERCLYNKLP